MYQTGSIREIHRQLQEQGYNVTENTLRVWVKDGTLASARCGRKAYINYQNVLNLLQNGTPDQTQSDSANVIRKISA